MDLRSASHDELIAVIRQQQAVIADLTATVARLEQRVRDLERGSGPAHGMPGHKPGPTPTPAPTRPRRRRTTNYARRRSTPTRQITHAVTHCPTCGLALAGGTVKRTREVIEVPQPSVVITEHVYLERCCPGWWSGRAGSARGWWR